MNGSEDFDPAAEPLPPGQATRLASLLAAVAGVPVSDAERRSLAWLAGFEDVTVANIATVIRRARARSASLAARAARDEARSRGHVDAEAGSATSVPDAPDPHPTTPEEAPMGRYMTLPDGTRIDLDEEIELSDGTRIKLGAATREQLADRGTLLLQRRADQLIEAALSRRIVEMMRRSDAATVADLDESAARDDLDRAVLRIAAEIIDEPVTGSSLVFVPRLSGEQYERCFNELELAQDDPLRTWERGPR